jgi:hypothetical protein
MRAVGREERMILGPASPGGEAPSPCIHGRRIRVIGGGANVAATGCQDCYLGVASFPENLVVVAEPKDPDARQADILASEWLALFTPGRDPDLVEEEAVARYRHRCAWMHGPLSDRAREIFRAWRRAREAEDAGA